MSWALNVNYILPVRTCHSLARYVNGRKTQFLLKYQRSNPDRNTYLTFTEKKHSFSNPARGSISMGEKPFSLEHLSIGTYSRREHLKLKKLPQQIWYHQIC